MLAGRVMAVPAFLNLGGQWRSEALWEGLCGHWSFTLATCCCRRCVKWDERRLRCDVRCLPGQSTCRSQLTYLPSTTELAKPSTLLKGTTLLSIPDPERTVFLQQAVLIGGKQQVILQRDQGGASSLDTDSDGGKLFL